MFEQEVKEGVKLAVVTLVVLAIILVAVQGA